MRKTSVKNGYGEEYPGRDLYIDGYFAQLRVTNVKKDNQGRVIEFFVTNGMWLGKVDYGAKDISVVDDYFQIRNKMPFYNSVEVRELS